MTLALLRVTPMDEATEERQGAPLHPELDPATLAACRVGQAGAIRAFVLHYETLVFAFLSRSLGRGPHVEDLAQEVFLRACRALPDFDEHGTARLSTWLLTIARRLTIDAHRKRQIPTTSLDTEERDAIAQVGAGVTPETERERALLGRALENAAAELPAEQREAFLLAEIHGLDMSELAQVQGVAESTARTRLFRARTKLRELLQGVWDAFERDGSGR